jgi:putative FmdB family regulatory protein
MFEARQRMTDDPLTECPKCEQDTVRRVINNVGIVFKGSGFYVTDNRNGSNGTVSSNGSSASNTSKDAEGSKTSDSNDKSSTTSTAKSEKAPAKK